MNQQNALDYIQHIKDFAAGKQMQIRDSESTWDDISKKEDIYFDLPPENYRVKPEPKLRPWTMLEFPMFAIFKSRDDVFGIPVIADETTAYFMNRRGAMISYSYNKLADNKLNLHSLDGGKTWKPCGVVE